MIRTPLTLSLPITRVQAAQISVAASRFICRITLEGGETVLNAKSMLGLLSQTGLSENGVALVTNGVDEQAAAETIRALLMPAKA